MRAHISKMFLNISEPLPLIPSFSLLGLPVSLSVHSFFFPPDDLWMFLCFLLWRKSLGKAPPPLSPPTSSTSRHLSNFCPLTTRESLCCTRNSVDLILITATTFAGKKSIALKEHVITHSHTLPSSIAELTGILAKWMAFLTTRQCVFFSLSRYHYRDQVLFSRQAVTEQSSSPQGR